MLFQVLAECNERKPVIITSNKGFGDWTQIFGDPSLLQPPCLIGLHTRHM